MTFKDIPGKAQEKSFLLQLVKKDRVPHAMLFVSKPGAGALPMALAFATYLACEDRTDTDACGVCAACRKTTRYLHPDVHYSFPVVKLGNKERSETFSDDYLPEWRKMLLSHPFMDIHDWSLAIKAEKTNPNINVKEVNEIIHKLTLMTYELGYKILIIWLPEYLQKEGNRLLKLIEEPPTNTFILLVTEDTSAILNTILSRCQQVKIASFRDQEIESYLEESMQLDGSRSRQIASVAQGNLNHALHLSHQESVDYSDMLVSWMRISYSSNPAQIIKWVDGIHTMTKDDIKSFLKYGMHFFRQLMLYNSLGKASFTQHEANVAANMAKLIDNDKALAISEILNDAIDMIDRNINIKILFSADTFSIGNIMKGKENVSLPLISV